MDVASDCHAKWCPDLSRKVVCWFVTQSGGLICHAELCRHCVVLRRKRWHFVRCQCGVRLTNARSFWMCCVWAEEPAGRPRQTGTRTTAQRCNCTKCTGKKKLVIYYLPHWRTSCSKNSGISDSFAWFENASLNLVVKQQGNGVDGVGGRGGAGREGGAGGWRGGGRERERKKRTNIMTVIWNHALGRLTTKGWKFLLLCYHKRILGDIYIYILYGYTESKVSDLLLHTLT